MKLILDEYTEIPLKDDHILVWKDSRGVERSEELHNGLPLLESGEDI